MIGSWAKWKAASGQNRGRRQANGEGGRRAQNENITCASRALAEEKNEKGTMNQI